MESTRVFSPARSHPNARYGTPGQTPSGGQVWNQVLQDPMGLLDQHDELKITLISLHGLIRGEDAELGRDADTGGQIKYALELARELAMHPNVGDVELLTRQIFDPRVSDDYAAVEETIAENAKIIRIPFGPRKYLRKEALWPYLDMFVDQCLVHFRRTGLPHIIHGHYADAGLAGAKLARLLHIPYIFTGHSLGRVKKERLVAGGRDETSIERKYRLGSRIEAEEVALETASMVVTSTNQEVESQYKKYDHYAPERMEVIPPGTDLRAFTPPTSDWQRPEIADQVDRFLTEPNKPMILAMARPDERKNLAKLVEVYGESAELRASANLCLIMGTRGDLADLPRSQSSIIQDILLLIDKYDLYGHVAYPKTHRPNDVAELYRYATSLRGVFVNAALTEPFGLTLLEAGATGLPIVATNDGGPRDIIGNCQNGILVDPLSSADIEHALMRMLTEPDQWDTWSKNGINGTRKHYSWSNHVRRYLRDLDEILDRHEAPTLITEGTARRLPDFDRIIVTDLDNTLTGDDEALGQFRELLAENENIGFGVATGRHLSSAMEMIDKLSLPQPDVLDTDSGTQLHYGPRLQEDTSWRAQIDHVWQPEKIVEALDGFKGLEPQRESQQSPFKLSYLRVGTKPPTAAAIRKHLRTHKLRAKVILSLDAYIDILPVRGGSDCSIRHLMWKWGFSPEKVLVAGDSGNDAGMLLGRTLGVVVANHGRELNRLRKRPRIYFAESSHAAGILEGINYYNFLGHIRIPNDQIEP